METSNCLPVGQTVSSISSTAEPVSVQPASMTYASAQVPQAPVIVPLQQSLVLQQYAFTHQSISNAAKSPAEIAAARAAEISKQLEVSGAVVDEESSRKAKSRSKTKSPSYSRSHSKSRSPIKRRRRRSRSLSPIRYRRDYYSSYGSRDYHGYRGHNYRSYYRGSYNDYSRYRINRDHDYHYRRRSRSRERRRSRTRSPRTDRNRGRRRSPTLSPPVPKRSDTGSSGELKKPNSSLPNNRSRSRSNHTSSRSLSREMSESRSASSRSVNVSPVRSRSRSDSQEICEGVKEVDEHPQTELNEEVGKKQMASNLKCPKGSNGTRQGGTESSSTPARSLSVSSSSDKYSDNSNEFTGKKGREVSEEGPSENADNGTTSPGKFSQEVHELKARWSHLGHECRNSKLTQGSHSISEGNDQVTELVGDWQKDSKKTVKGKDNLADEEEDFIAARQSRTRISEIDLIKRGGSFDASSTACELMEVSVVRNSSFAAHEGSKRILQELQGMPNQDKRIVMVHDNTDQYVTLTDLKDLSDGRDDSAPSNAEDLVFEGPQPAYAICDERKQSFEEGTKIDVSDRKVRTPISVDRRTEADDICAHNKGHLHHHKTEIRDAGDKDRDRSKCSNSKKGRAGPTKHDGRRNKHKSHRKRHKHESTDEDAERPKKRHKRKHRRESKHSQRERNKRRHKHKDRLSITEDSSSADEIEVERAAGKKRKSPKKRRASNRDLLESSPSSASMT